MSERDLFANFERMRREMDELFGDVLERTRIGRRRFGFTPAVDIRYSADPPCAIVTAELAGVVSEELELEIQGRKVILSGRRPPPAADDDLYQQVEIERGSFRRVIELSADVVPDEAKARYEDGMLRIELPLVRTETQHRSVPIQSSEPRS